MRLLDRYLLRELLIPFTCCLGGFLIVWIAFDLFTGLNRYQENNLRLGDVVELYEYKLPEILVLILPIVLLLALLYALTEHARHHELTAMRAAGVSLMRICIPYLAVGALLGWAVYGMNEHWVPDSANREQSVLDRHNPRSSTAGNNMTNIAFNIHGDFWGADSRSVDADFFNQPRVRRDTSEKEIKIVADQARYVDGAWMFLSSHYFSTGDLIDLSAFAAKLIQPAEGDELSQFLGSKLSPGTAKLLAEYQTNTNAPDARLQAALVDELNHVVRDGPIYRESRFAGVKLDPVLKNLAEEQPDNMDEMWVNRMLIIAAYPREFDWARSQTVREFESVGGAQPKPTAATNLLLVPGIRETPLQIRSELVINELLSKANSQGRTAEIPIAVIRAYLKLHPQGLGRADQAWLLTQYYSRTAVPFTCIVVVLIAIPFGAASGRRNLFAGVAGSIVICFVYYVLVKLGQAAGMGGIVPPWLATWFPNVSFSVAAIWLMLRVR